MIQIREFWQELDDEQAEKLSGGDKGSLTGSIEFTAVIRPAYRTIAPIIAVLGESSIYAQAIAPANGKIRGTLLL